MIKKYLTVVTLTFMIIFAGSIFFSSQAQAALHEGDTLRVYKLLCHNCKMIGIQIYNESYNEWVRNDFEPPNRLCPATGYEIDHYLTIELTVWYKYHRDRNWVEIRRE